MKKTRSFLLILAAVLAAVSLASCHGPVSGDPATGDVPAVTTGDATGPETAPLSFQIQRFEKDGISVEFVKISGMTDANLQIRLNQKIKDFYTWQWLQSAPEDTAKYTATASCCQIGNYLSVVRILEVVTEDSAYSSSEFSAQTFDLRTGDAVDTVLLSGREVMAVSEKFQLTHPASEAPGVECFAAYLADNDLISTCCFTSSGVAIYIPHPKDLPEDYLLFEAAFADAFGVLTLEAAAQLQEG